MFFNLFNPPPKFQITGASCILKPLIKKDLGKVKNWLRDRDLIRYAFGILADESVLDKIGREFIRDIFSTSTEVLAIWTLSSILVGFVNYSKHNFEKKAARIGILIGEEKFRSCGIGTEALLMALLYLFDRVGLEWVDLDTALFNHRAKHCFEKCGFKLIGEITEMNFLSGDLVYKYLMKIRRDDFLQNTYHYFDKLPSMKGKIPASLFLQSTEKE